MRLRFAQLGGAILAVSFLSCKDSIAPDPLTLTVNMHLVNTETAQIGDFPAIVCTVSLRASAVGNQNQGAIWGNGVVRFYAGPDRSAPLDTATLSASELNDSWTGGVHVGDPRESQWYFGFTFPFRATIDFHYHSSTGDNPVDKVTRDSLDCGAKPVDLPAPAVGAVSWTPTRDLSPGDTLKVRYDATGSSAGLWATAVDVSGPCQAGVIFFEGNAHDVSRTGGVPIPADCANGTLTVRVSALDYMIQNTSTSRFTGPAVVDNRHPWFTVSFTDSMAPGIQGEFFDGDTLRVVLSATDNGPLNSFHWELPDLAVHDSITLGPSAKAVTMTRAIPIPPAWVGAHTMRFYARDESGLSSDTMTTPVGLFGIHPTVTHPYVEGGKAGRQITSIVEDGPRDVLYASEESGTHIYIISRVTGDQVGEIALPSRIADIDLTVSGDSLVASQPDDHAVAFVDLANPAHPVAVLPMQFQPAVDELPAWVGVTSQGLLFTVLHPVDVFGSWRLGEINLATGAQQVRVDGNTPPSSAPRILRSADRSVLTFVSGDFSRRYLSGSNTFGQAHVTGDSWRPALDSQGQRLAVGLNIFGPDLMLQRHLRLDRAPNPGETSSRFSADGGYVYAAIGSFVYRANAGDGSILDRFAIPEGSYVRAVSGSSIVTSHLVNDSIVFRMIDVSH